MLSRSVPTRRGNTECPPPSSLPHNPHCSWHHPGWQRLYWHPRVMVGGGGWVGGVGSGGRGSSVAPLYTQRHTEAGPHKHSDKIVGWLSFRPWGCLGRRSPCWHLRGITPKHTHTHTHLDRQTDRRQTHTHTHTDLVFITCGDIIKTYSNFLETSSLPLQTWPWS